MPNDNYGGSNLGGGPFNGFMPRQTVHTKKDSEYSVMRSILRKSWNGAYATGVYNNQSRKITPFRAVNNSGDFLARVNYVCGGPNPTNLDKPGRGTSIGNIISQCDLTGVPASSCNVKYVADSSDYVTFRRQSAINKTYNDLSYVGNRSNGSYSALMRVRRR